MQTLNVMSTYELKTNLRLKDLQQNNWPVKRVFKNNNNNIALTRAKGGEAVSGHELLSGLDNQMHFAHLIDTAEEIWGRSLKVCEHFVHDNFMTLFIISWLQKKMSLFGDNTSTRKWRKTTTASPWKRKCLSGGRKISKCGKMAAVLPHEDSF